MYIIVSGPRDWTNLQRIKEILYKEINQDNVVVQGGALAAGLPVKIFYESGIALKPTRPLKAVSRKKERKTWLT